MQWLSQRMKDKKRTVLIVIFFALVALVIVSAVNLFILWRDGQRSDALYEETTQKYVTIEEGTKDTQEEAFDTPVQTETEETNEAPWQSLCEVDFDSLKAINEDIIGYLYFENEDIRYPILYSGDNDKYLRATFDGADASAGSIFLEGQNTPDFSDPHTIIYGHNMRNLSMFGKLKFYRQKEDYFDTHRYFQIITPDRKMRYKVETYKNVDANDDIYTVVKTGGTDFVKFANDTVLRDGLRQAEDPIGENNMIVTLSTCSVNDSTRFVVIAFMEQAVMGDTK